MARVQVVDGRGEPRTWTVVGTDGLPIEPLEEWLEYLRVQGFAPNTLRAYAKATAELWTFLGHLERGWVDVDVKAFQGFHLFLRTGQLPGLVSIADLEDPRSTPVPLRRQSTVNARLAAVLSFYRYHRYANDVPVHARLHRAGSRSPARNETLLAHLDRGQGVVREVPLLRLRSDPPRPQPLLSVAQVDAILTGCGTGDALQDPRTLRDRLLFETLAETGMRLGEVLCLQHRDWHVGGGTTPYVEVEPRDHPRGYRTKGGRWRRIHISDGLAARYSEHVWQLVDAGADEVLELNHWWVLVNWERGERFAALSASTVYDKVRALRRMLRGSVPAAWTPHWFRHTHATALLMAGIPEHVIMRRLGHAHIQTTRQLYGWVTEEAELRAVAGWASATHERGWRLHDDPSGTGC